MKTLAIIVCVASALNAAPQSPAPPNDRIITPSDCVADKVGTAIPPSSIGEAVSSVTLNAPEWRPAANGIPAYCSVQGSMAPVDKAASARPIRFGVAMPAAWTGRAAQLGGGGMNGSVPNLAGAPGRSQMSFLERGFATYGSDSGHQGGFGRGAPSDPDPNAWATNEEAIANLGYMQLKKSHDAAMVILQRVYGGLPRFNYFFGGSQGGREALTVAQRYPADYDGIAAEVPIVSFSSLMLAPELIRIQEKPLANWVPPAKINAIRGEFIRQCDKLDGLADGIINNYMGCRAIFDVKQAPPDRKPWSSKRCPGNVDPNPQDTSAAACLTDGQIATLEMVYSRYRFAAPLAHGVTSFGMWLPNTDPSGSGLIASTRFRGQEGAADGAGLHSHLGALGVTGFLMKDPSANPLDYVEGGKWNARRIQLSAILDATEPNLTAFQKRGGKLIVVIGTNDTLASPGAQLDYYQSVIAKMGRANVDSFARFFVLPQTDHGLNGRNYGITGDGKEAPLQPIPSSYDRFGLITGWVENGRAPGKFVTVTAGARSLPMCSYPEFPKYKEGPVEAASSYLCSEK